MIRLVSTVAALSLTAMLAVPATAQTAPEQRNGTTAGGPGAYGRPGELAPGQKPMSSRRMGRSAKQRSGTDAGGPAVAGIPGELAPGQKPRSTSRGARRMHQKSGTDAGGPASSGIPGEVKR